MTRRRILVGINLAAAGWALMLTAIRVLDGNIPVVIGAMLMNFAGALIIGDALSDRR